MNRTGNKVVIKRVGLKNGLVDAGTNRRGKTRREMSGKFYAELTLAEADEAGDLDFDALAGAGVAAFRATQGRRAQVIFAPRAAIAAAKFGVHAHVNIATEDD